MELPRFTIVTPSYNQGRYLEQTIRSVLGQRYPRLDYIVMDGGSTDGSAAIIERYAPWLAHWQTGRDHGQAQSILDGFRHGDGSLLAFVNSDDLLLPGALWTVARHFLAHRDCHLAVGDNVVIDAAGDVVGYGWSTPPDHATLLHWGCTFAQTSSFWTREAFERVGGFDGGLQFAFDLDLFMRLTRERRAEHIPRFLSAVRYHAETKTSTIPHIGRAEDARLRAAEGAGDASWVERRAVRLSRHLFRSTYTRVRGAMRRAGLVPLDPLEPWFAALRSHDLPLGALPAPPDELADPR